MGGESVCGVCGNEVEPGLAACPFCKQPRQPLYGKAAAEQFRVVNLERGMPLVRDALQRLTLELESAARGGCDVLVLIHGYGSSGKGGAIKEAVRRQLRFNLDRKILREVVPGEECGKRFARARQIMKRFPFLGEFTRNPNPGITLVFI